MLRLEAVSKDYKHRGKIVRALDDVTLEIGKGDFVSIIGPSGSGKSTFLLMLGGMLSPTEGKVLIEGDSLYDLTPDERAVGRRRRSGSSSRPSI